MGVTSSIPPHPMANGLVALRSILVVLVACLFPLGVAAVVLADATGSGAPFDPFLAAVVVGLLGGASLAGSWRLGQPLDCASAEDLAGSYRTRFFLRVVVADAAALAGFGAAPLSGSVLAYLVGAACALIGFVRAAPTRSRLEREQVQLIAQGCGQQLVEALQSPRPVR